jgi:hypothetical protein
MNKNLSGAVLIAPLKWEKKERKGKDEKKKEPRKWKGRMQTVVIPYHNILTPPLNQLTWFNTVRRLN